MRPRPPDVSLVLRLRAAQATDGVLIGHAEVVETGEVVPVHGLADVVALVRRLGASR